MLAPIHTDVERGGTERLDLLGDLVAILHDDYVCFLSRWKWGNHKNSREKQGHSEFHGSSLYQ